MTLNSSCWIYFLARWLWYKLYIFLQSNLLIFVGMHMNRNCAFTVFYMNLLFFMKGHLGRMTSSNSAVTIRFFNRALRCSFMVSPLSDFSKHGSTSCSYLSPLFQLEGTNTHTHFSLSRSARCSINLWRGPVGIAPRFLYRLYMQNGCRSNYFNSTRYELCSCIASDVCTQETCWRKVNIFSLILFNRNGPVSLSVCVKIFCWKEERCCCMYGKLLRTLYICAICGNYSCLCFIANFKALCYFLYQILNLRTLIDSICDGEMIQEKSRSPPSFLTGVRTLQVRLSY